MLLNRRRALPAALALGFAAVMAVVVGGATAGIDLPVEVAVNGAVAAHAGVAAAAAWFEPGRRSCSAGWCWLVLILAALGLARKRWTDPRAALAALGAAVAAEAIARPLAMVIARPRPFPAHPHLIYLMEGPSFDFSFPSDGAVASFAIAAALIVHHRKLGLAAYGLALLVVFDRLAVGAHYPSDVLGGLLLGSAVGIVCGRLAARYHQPSAASSESSPMRASGTTPRESPPLRSIQMPRRPACWAPAMSRRGLSPTMAASAGPHATAASAARKMAGSGLDAPTPPEVTTASNRSVNPDASSLARWCSSVPFVTTARRMRPRSDSSTATASS
jgi:undecaprenyl-diphosphatase